MPELIGKWHYRMPSFPSIYTSEESILNPHPPLQNLRAKDQVLNSCLKSLQARESDPLNRWCYCNGDDEGEMIFCEDESCLIKWFHTSCLRISRIPKGKWYCPDYRKKKSYQVDVLNNSNFK